MRKLAGLIGVLVVAVGCQARASAPQLSDPRASTPPAKPSCSGTIHGHELRGQASPNQSLWALLFTDYPLPRATQVKIVWRMTGDDDLTIDATGPGGQRISPTWGPEEHSGSNWNKPGGEWGTGYDFPTGGCWTLTLDRGTNRGTVHLLVA